MKGLLKRLLGAGIGVALMGLAPMPASAEQDVFVIAKAQDPTSLDPAFTMTNNDWTITYPAYQRLVRYGVKDGVGQTSVEGELAKSWEASEDGKTWTFTLVDGQAFDDGTPVDAAAVKFSFDRLKAMGNGPADAFPTLESVEVIDPKTVRFHLAEPFAPFLYTLANNGAAIVNPAIASHEKDGDHAQGWLSSHTAGSGAFRLVSWDKGQSIVLEPNPHYGGEAPAFSKVVVKMIGEASTRRLQLVNGDVDLAEELPIDQLDAIANEDGVVVKEYPSFRITQFYLNTSKPPLDDPDVRRAINHAIDYQGIIDGILLGKGIQMRGPIPKGMWGHDETVLQYDYDLDKAKELIAGKDIGTLNYLYASTDPNWEPIGLLLQASLAQLGIKLEMENLAYATMREHIDKGDFNIAVGNWTPDFSDPYMFMNYWFDSAKFGLAGNRSFYKNEKVDELIRTAARLTSQEERTKLYREAQEIVVNDAVYAYLFQRNENIAMREDVKGFVFNPMLVQIYNLADMSKSE